MIALIFGNTILFLALALFIIERLDRIERKIDAIRAAKEGEND